MRAASRSPGCLSLVLCLLLVSVAGCSKKSPTGPSSVAPTANFVADRTSGTPPLTVAFTDHSTAGSSAITSWSWKFGDGASAVAQNPSHIYAAAGTYTVSLTVVTAVDSNTITRANYLRVAGAGGGPAAFGAKTDYATGSYPRTVAIGDLNGDGKPDLVVANSGYSPTYGTTVSVLLSNGNGTFGPRTDFVTGINPISVAIGDLNGDGKPDLAVANQSSSTVSVLLGNGGGTFAARTDFVTGSYPTCIVIRDLNQDGTPDLVTASLHSPTVSVLLGNGNGTFGPKTNYGTGQTPTSVAVGDLNGDGKPDLATANYNSSTVSVLLGNGDGTFGAKNDYPAVQYPYAVAIGDLNGDGKPDLAVANCNASGTVSVLLGNGNGAFGPKTDYVIGGLPNSVAIVDLNGDGKPELATANASSSTVSVLLGDGQGAFGAKSDFATGIGPVFVAAGDLNGDSRPDLVVANGDWGHADNTVSVLLNAGSYLSLDRLRQPARAVHSPVPRVPDRPVPRLRP